MKKILSINQNSLGVDTAILIARVTIGLLMLVHGLPKMQGLFSAGPVQFASVFGMSAGMSMSLAVFAEVFCSILLIAGIGTRLAVLPLIITMLVAVFVIHVNDPFAKQELGLHYLLVYVILLITGSGRFSIDYLMSNKRPLKAVRAANWKNNEIADPTLTIYQ